MFLQSRFVTVLLLVIFLCFFIPYQVNAQQTNQNLDELCFITSFQEIDKDEHLESTRAVSDYIDEPASSATRTAMVSVNEKIMKLETVNPNVLISLALFEELSVNVLVDNLTSRSFYNYDSK
jgi:hypothetical protein